MHEKKGIEICDRARIEPHCGIYAQRQYKTVAVPISEQPISEQLKKLKYCQIYIWISN
jgi:hypothetical protein